jgi:serine protease AprX
VQAVIIDPNLDHPDGADEAKRKLEALVIQVGGVLSPVKSRQHVFAKITLKQLKSLVQADRPDESSQKLRLIYKIWPDTKLQAFLDRSVRVIKADACIRTFGSDGDGIIWAVIDSGIDGDHPHFSMHHNLNLEATQAANAARAALIKRVDHQDFTGKQAALVDVYGHGTHVAGIIAGATPSVETAPGERIPAEPGAVRLVRRRTEDNSVRLYPETMRRSLSGVAPKCKLVSLKVLDERGSGEESALLAALDYVSDLNEDGKRIRIHGVNISIGYPFDAEWFAAGQSPACVTVDRLVRSGVVVVVAAGNDGSVLLTPAGSPSLKRVGLDQSIADPGNAERAITVGSTHPESPHTFGVSYFSSRGPTADGRSKPDLVAPGERIVSCASQQTVARAKADAQLEGDFDIKSGVAYYREESGTSMAAPHVSGAAAAFLSIHREFVGQPERLKEVLVTSATDLKRKRDFQGAGLVDLLRAIQSV